ncbi:MAG: LacI family DNA-binding transcriptional regulator [Phycisphaerae bacterium]|nr:LacI family DNA-binding transcriptional regulator [Phycisphaerae bacterium]
MASVRRIAKQAGVSVATVSRVLNNHPHVDEGTRKKVLEVADKASYVRLSQRSQAVLGLVYPGDIVKADHGNFDQAVLGGILEGVHEQRYDVKIISIARDKSPQETYAQFFARKGLRGVVLRTFAHTRQMCVKIAEEGFPAVVIADRFSEPGVNYVCTDSSLDSVRAVRHLIDLGHRRIGLIVHSVADTDHADRRAAYESTMRDAGLEIDPELIAENYATADNAASAVTRFMGLPRPPTAIFITDPLATVGALRRCLEMGIRVPSELSIIGFDDSDVRLHTFPTCTAVVQDARMLGMEAARWLSSTTAEEYDGSEPRRFTLVRQTRFEVNRTTAPPPREPVRVLADGTRPS